MSNNNFKFNYDNLMAVKFYPHMADTVAMMKSFLNFLVIPALTLSLFQAPAHAQNWGVDPYYNAPGNGGGLPDFGSPSCPDSLSNSARLVTTINDPQVLSIRLDGLLNRGLFSRALSDSIEEEIKSGQPLLSAMVTFRQNGEPNLNSISNYLADFQGNEARTLLVSAGEALEKEFVEATSIETLNNLSRMNSEQYEILKTLTRKHITENVELKNTLSALQASELILKTSSESLGMNPEVLHQLRSQVASGKPLKLKDVVNAKLNPIQRMWFKIKLRADWMRSTQISTGLLKQLVGRSAVTHQELFRLMGYNNLVGAVNRNGEFYIKLKTLLKEEQASVINDLFADPSVRTILKSFSEQQMDISSMVLALEQYSQVTVSPAGINAKSEAQFFNKIKELFMKKKESVDDPAENFNPLNTPEEDSRNLYRSAYSPYYSTSNSTGFPAIPGNRRGNVGYGNSGMMGMTQPFPVNKVLFEVVQQVAADLYLLKDLAGVRAGVQGRFQKSRDILDVLKKEYLVLDDALKTAKNEKNKNEIRQLKFELHKKQSELIEKAKETQTYATQIVTSYMNWGLHANLDRGLIGNERVAALSLPAPLRMNDPELKQQWDQVYDEALAIAINPLYNSEMKTAVFEGISRFKNMFTKHNDNLKKYWDVDFFETPLGAKARAKSKVKFAELSKGLFKALMLPGEAISKDPATQKMINYAWWTGVATLVGLNAEPIWEGVTYMTETTLQALKITGSMPVPPAMDVPPAPGIGP